MNPILSLGTNLTSAMNDHAELRRYVRLEYREGEVGWLLAAAAADRPSLRRRLRYWINSFRGFAAFDIRGSENADRL